MLFYASNYIVVLSATCFFSVRNSTTFYRLRISFEYSTKIFLQKFSNLHLNCYLINLILLIYMLQFLICDFYHYVLNTYSQYFTLMLYILQHACSNFILCNDFVFILLNFKHLELFLLYIVPAYRLILIALEL